MHYVYEIAIGPKKQIGSTSYIQKRMNKHLRELIKNSHWNSYMQNAYNKYLIFNYSILSSWKTREEAFIEEQRLLDNFFGKENYTMQSKKAIGASPDSEYVRYWKGKKLPDAMKQKISNAQKGRKLSEDHKRLISESLKGEKKSDFTKEKMKGPKSDKMKRAMSDYAKNRSSSHRENLSKSTKGKKLSLETKKKISNSQKGISKLGNAKSINQFDKNGKFIRTFSSVVEASKHIGVHPSSISNVARGISKTSAGFIWKY
jgi:hypothetical protein